jgi:hypothetical protein
MNLPIATALSLLLVAGLAGCLLSITEHFEYDVLKEIGEDYLDLSGTSRTVVDIDLSNDDTFADNRDKIRTIDRAGFEAKLYSLDGESAVADLYFRHTSDDGWILLLEGVSVSGSSTEKKPTVISYEESEKLIRNFAAFQKVAEGGVMQFGIGLRGGRDVATVRITQLILIVTLTAGT